MTAYHMNADVNKKIIELLDELCQWERDTGRETTLLLIPHNPDEKLLIALNGKPVSNNTAAKSDMFYVEAFHKRKKVLMGLK